MDNNSHKNCFNSDDETKIFGKRQIAESNGQIFECLTLASFPVNDEVCIFVVKLLASANFVIFLSDSR